MIERHRSQISFAIILMIMCSSLRLVDRTTIHAQEDVVPEDLLSLDNVTISTDFFSTCLEVVYTRYGGLIEITDLESQVLLFLSLNNDSWIEVKRYTLDDDILEENITRMIRICNSLSESFPFDIKKGETLYICIEYWYRSSLELGYRIFRTPSLAIVVPVDIVRPWYLILDLKLPAILGVILLGLFIVYYIRRRRIVLIE